MARKNNSCKQTTSAPLSAAWSTSATCLSIIARLIFSTGDVVGSHSVA